ncbi:DUF1631 family protein [Chitinibacter fontanus]|uniref:DUF1631 family protein n=1 Tax=Chitinibacter fontanus TaxID=1737446 RepID=A0A7D5V8H4_9NEIS|nr:DUF1631 family protein [Chitinibacter fontanus]QLI80634.1 DUF1631 family protein [Chitinibacter fontanus]
MAANNKAVLRKLWMDMDRNDLLTATRGVFLRTFNQVLPTLLSDGADALFLKADRASSLIEQRAMLDARAVLMSQEQALLNGLIDNMEKLLTRSYQTAYSTFRPSFSDSAANNRLSLIDVGDFDGELKIDELTTRLRNAAEEELRDLNIRMAILFDQDDINERENPFRPYLMTRCLSMTAEQLHIEPQLHEVVCEALAEQLQKRVVAIYQALNQLLAQHGIAAQLQLRIRQLPDAATLRQMAAEPLVENDSAQFAHGDYVDTAAAVTVGAGPQPYMEGGYSSPMQNGVPIDPVMNAQNRLGQWTSMLRQQAENTQAAAAELPLGAAVAGWLGTVKQVGAAIRQLWRGQADIQLAPQVLSVGLAQSIDQLRQPHLQGVQLDAQGQVRNVILEQRAELSAATSDINEQMIVDIVGMLFEFILRDVQVPAEIRAQLGRLQWLVLKTALQDPALFSQKHHPARLLVNRIGSIAQGLQQLDPKAERVTAEIRRIIETLLRDEEESTALFSQMLDELDRFIARELRAADEQSALASQALENAESRTLRFARITAQVSQALQSFTLDAQLESFLTHTWPYAIEYAERNDPVQALRFRIFVPELIWSIAPKNAKEDRQQLLGMIPRLIGVLSEGLKYTPWSNAEQQTFKLYMMDAHRSAIAMAGNETLEVPSMALLRAQMANFISEIAADSEVAQVEASAEINPVLLDQAISELKVEIGFIDRQVEADLAHLGVEAANDAEGLSNEALFEFLRSGVPVELNLTGELRQARLCWMNPNETRLVLNMDADSPPSVISISVFKRLLACGRARWLEQAPLFERAMESLLNSADQLDLQAA